MYEHLYEEPQIREFSEIFFYPKINEILKHFWFENKSKIISRNFYCLYCYSLSQKENANGNFIFNSTYNFSL